MLQDLKGIRQHIKQNEKLSHDEGLSPLVPRRSVAHPGHRMGCVELNHRRQLQNPGGIHSGVIFRVVFTAQATAGCCPPRLERGVNSGDHGLPSG